MPSSHPETRAKPPTDGVLGLIGDTPLVELNRYLGANEQATLFAKLECFNLTGSVKDRTAIGLIEAAETSGALRPGGTIVESTSGNLGISLAMICARKGYKCICVVDPKAAGAAVNRIRALGATIEVVATPDTNGSFQIPRVARARELAASIEGAVHLDQYTNPANLAVHYDTTGPEIYRSMGARIDVLVGSVSTGGHLCGSALYLRERIPALVVIGVEPEGSVLFGGEGHSFLQNGSGLSFVPITFRRDLITYGVKVSDRDAFLAARRFARAEGLLVGGSSGSVLHAACRYAEAQSGPTRIVMILPDDGDRYLDSIYSDTWMSEHGLSADHGDAA